MNADVERAMNWLKGMADDRGYTEHLAHGGKGDPIEEQEIECASTALKYIESLQAQLAKEKRRAERAVADIYHMGGCPNCIYNKGRHPDTGLPMCAKLEEFPDGQCFKWRGDAEEGDGE